MYHYNYLLHLRTWLIIKRKNLLDRMPLLKGKKYVPFIILCQPRSGSTLLHTYLNFNPQVRSYGEILREHVESKKSHLTNVEIIESVIFNDHTAALKGVGLKMFYDYHNDPLYRDAFSYINRHHEIHIIHLIRQDILKLYTSLKIAEQTSVWSSGLVSSTHEKVTLDCKDYRRFFHTYTQNKIYFSNLFKDHPVLNIAYEDLYEQPEETLNLVQQFLGIKPRKLVTLLKKQNPQPLSVLIQNYEEIKSVDDSLNKADDE